MEPEKQASEPEVSEVVVSGTRTPKIDWTVKPDTHLFPKRSDAISASGPIDPNAPYMGVIRDIKKANPGVFVSVPMQIDPTAGLPFDPGIDGHVTVRAKGKAVKLEFHVGNPNEQPAIESAIREEQKRRDPFKR
jgi:hypothetical protein